MTYTLLIVESPAKCGKIEHYLGSNYKCIASFGHLQELNSLKDIDINNNFKLNFTVIPSKIKQIDKIKKMISHAKEVVLATDDDREGEGIAWHICKLFNLNIFTTKRIIFHEVTEKGIKSAISNPININLNLVNAQQTRQILDLLVGYLISPKLWEKIVHSRSKKALSAGRCQTPALRLIYENYLDIKESPGIKIYNITGYFTDINIPFILNFNYENNDEVQLFLKNSILFDHKLTVENPKQSIRKSPLPFTTSSLQQVASNELNISPKETMNICQKLYENGYITYMRTDSKIYSSDFVELTLNYIETKYGSKFKTNDIPKITISKTNILNKKTNPQEAHEAIRPTNIYTTKLDSDKDFSNKEIKMYSLIWKNTIQSCMADALYQIILSKITAPFEKEYKFTCENLLFEGWQIINSNKISENKSFQAYHYLPKLHNKIVNYNNIIAKNIIKDTKLHHTESKLVNELEKRGIGRPSTFSSIVEKIQERGYVKKENIKGMNIECIDFELKDKNITQNSIIREFGNEKNKLVLQDIGKIVIEFLLKSYKSLFEYDYTSKMEEQLDLIAKGEVNYIEICKKILLDINTENENIKNYNKCIIKIDENYTFIIGIKGPVIRTKENKFLSVKKDLSIEKLKNAEYSIDEILDNSNSNSNNLLGTYQEKEVYIKKGKYGLYAEWGNIKKSIHIDKDENLLEINDIIPLLENKNKNLIRTINTNLSIRNGKYGDYIFYKTSKMKNPKFYKLDKFELDYKTCPTSILLQWILENYNI